MTIRNAEARLPQTFVTKPDAESMAQRAFWRGAFAGAATLTLVILVIRWIA